MPRPGVQNWLLLTVSLGFVATGILIVPTNRHIGINTLVFFGGCAIVFAGTIVRKFRFRRSRNVLKVDITGGVPIRPSRALVLSLGLALLISGSVLLFFGDAYPPIFTLLTGTVAAVGAMLLLGLFFRFLPVGYIQFDPFGLSIGGRLWTVMIPWDRISRVAPGEFHDNAVLFIWISQFEALEVQPVKHRHRALKKLASNVQWVGAPVMIMTGHYRLSLPLLVKAIERYVTDPSLRDALESR